MCVLSGVQAAWSALFSRAFEMVLKLYPVASINPFSESNLIIVTIRTAPPLAIHF